MRVKFPGPDHIIRIVDPYQWDRSNDHTVDIPDPLVAADLLTTTEFVIADDEPLLALPEATTDRLVALTIAGVADWAALANADPAFLAQMMELDQALVATWIEHARTR